METFPLSNDLMNPSQTIYSVSWECKGSIAHFATFYMLLILFFNNVPIKLTKIVDRYLKIVEYVK